MTVRLGPIGPSELSRILRRSIGWAPAWPRMLHIAELSGGNPMHAVELIRALGAAEPDQDPGSLPATVVELARARVGKLPPRVRDGVKLASVPRVPTLDLLGRLDAGGAGPARCAGRRGAQRHRHHRRGADPLHPPDPRRRRVRLDSRRPPPRTAPRRRDALRRPGGTRPAPGRGGVRAGSRGRGRAGRRGRAGMAARRPRRRRRTAAPVLPTHAGFRLHDAGAAADRVRPPAATAPATHPVPSRNSNRSSRRCRPGWSARAHCST